MDNDNLGPSVNETMYRGITGPCYISLKVGLTLSSVYKYVSYFKHAQRSPI